MIAHDGERGTILDRQFILGVIRLDKRIEQIRESEKKSHIEMYSNDELYKSGSWLNKPIKTIKEITPLFKDYKKLNVLDLGCGVVKSIEEYDVQKDKYDFIIAVSALEHVESKTSFINKLI